MGKQADGKLVIIFSWGLIAAIFLWAVTAANSTGYERCKVDVVLMLDTSSSLSGFGTSTTDAAQKGEIDFVRKLIQLLPVDSENTHISLVTFSNTGILHWTFRDKQTKEALFHKLDNLEHYVGKTNFSAAFEAALRAFNDSNGERGDAPNFAVLFTDGTDTFDKKKTMDSAAKLRNNTGLIVIGVGTNVDRYELDSMSSENAAMFVQDYFDSFVLGPLSNKLCPDDKCGGVFKDAKGVLESPGASGLYTSNLYCEYIIIQPEDRGITVNFTKFSLEGPTGENCRNDYVEITEGEGPNAVKIGRFCGQNIPVIRTEKNILKMVFVSDDLFEGVGFAATYAAHIARCGGKFNKGRGYFKSPSISGLYTSNLHCEYTITVPEDKTIDLYFLTFILEDPTGSICQNDYVEIFDGLNETHVDSFCDKDVPDVIRSRTNVLKILFVTNADKEYEGFTAIYRSVALPSQVMEDLRAPYPYRFIYVAIVFIIVATIIVLMLPCIYWCKRRKRRYQVKMMRVAPVPRWRPTQESQVR